MGGQLLRMVLQAAAIAVLARLLDPSDYGLLAMVLAIIGVGDLLRDFGLSSAAIQAKTVLPLQRTNLFWINAAIGAVLSVLVFGLSWPIAALYGDPRLQPLAAVLAVTFLLNGLATQFRADLNRRLRFGVLAVADIAGQALGLGAAIGAALAGWSYWALAVQQIVPVIVGLVVVAGATRWWPGLPRRGVPMRGFLAFGGNLVAVQVLTYASRNVSAVLIGATVGARPLGLYNRAYNLMNLPLTQLNSPATRVALPVLSRLQAEPQRFAEFLRVGQTVMMNLAGVVVILSAAQAGPVIAIALGPNWAEAVPLFQILAVGGFFTAIGYANYWVFLAKGLTRQNLVMSAVTRPLLIVLIAVGAMWGSVGVAVAYSLGCVLLWPVALIWLARVSDAPVRMMTTNGLRTLAVHAVAGVGSWASTLGLPDDAVWTRLGLGSVVYLAVLALAVAAVPAYRSDVTDIVRLRRHFARRRPAVAVAEAV